MSSTVLVLIHGAGHTSQVWGATQEHLRHRSLAVDLPGRHDRPADLAAVTIDESVESLAADIRAAGCERVVLVGHSVGGIVLPRLAADLGDRVDHLVFVAGLCAPEGCMVADTVRPGRAADFSSRRDELRERYRDHMFAPVGTAGVAVIDDIRDAMAIDSLNFMTQAVSWEGVAPSLPRTFVRCLHDPIQPPALQDRLIEHCSASRVIDLESGHTPAIDVPVDLAAILDGIADGA